MFGAAGTNTRGDDSDEIKNQPNKKVHSHDFTHQYHTHFCLGTVRPPTLVTRIVSPDLSSDSDYKADPLEASLSIAHTKYPAVSTRDVNMKIALTPSLDRKKTRIEIAPGLILRLRGAKETWACIEQDFFIPSKCCSCLADLFCIMDANYVICPKCRVVSPLDDGADQDYDGGVGLGFTYKELHEWQCKIVHQRRNISE